MAPCLRHITLEFPHAAPAPFLRVKPSAFYQCQHLGILAGRTLWEAVGQSMLVCWPRRGSRQGEGKETRPCFGGIRKRKSSRSPRPAEVAHIEKSSMYAPPAAPIGLIGRFARESTGYHKHQ